MQEKLREKRTALLPASLNFYTTRGKLIKKAIFTKKLMPEFYRIPDRTFFKFNIERYRWNNDAEQDRASCPGRGS